MARWASAVVSARLTTRLLIVEPRGADQPPLHLALDLLEHEHRRDRRRQRPAGDRRLLRAVEPLEQHQQPVEVQPARGRERILRVEWGQRVGHGR